MKRQWYGVQPDERLARCAIDEFLEALRKVQLAMMQVCGLLPSHLGIDAKEAGSSPQPPVDAGSKPATGQELRRTSLMAEDRQVTRGVAEKVSAALGIPLRVLWAEPSGEDSGNV